MPAITLAHYDPVTRQTVIEGDFSRRGGSTFNDEIGVYANDAPDPTGLGEGQRPIGVAQCPDESRSRITSASPSTATLPDSSFRRR